MSLQVLNIVVVIVIASYLVYLYFFDCRQVSDERRELIRLKSLRVSQKVICFVLIAISIAHFFQVNMNTHYLVAILVFSTCVSEVFSKIYFERLY